MWFSLHGKRMLSIRRQVSLPDADKRPLGELGPGLGELGPGLGGLGPGFGERGPGLWERGLATQGISNSYSGPHRREV